MLIGGAAATAAIAASASAAKADGAMEGSTVRIGKYLEEAVKIDGEIPALHVAAAHWAETAEPFIRSKCPNSRFESFGGHMMFWEYPDRFNAILSEFLQTT